MKRFLYFYNIEGESKRGMKNKILYLIYASILIIFLLSLSIPNTEAVGVGVSPATLHFGNMLREGYAEGYFYVSVGTDDFVTVSVSPRGEIAEWLEFPDGAQFEVNKVNQKRFKVVIKPPADVANGVYSGVITFTTAPLGSVEGAVGSAIQASVEARITIEITDLQFLKCKVKNFEIKSTEENQPILISVRVQNEGNVRVKPEVSVVVWNQRQDEVVKSFNLKTSENVLPTTEKDFFFSPSSEDLGISQYWADLSVSPCEDSKLLTFDIVEPGSLALDGIFKTILTKVWVDIGEITPVTAVFQNVGEAAVKAKFRGNVELNGRVVQLLETEEVVVDVGETTNLTTFFTPKGPGRYIIRGRIYYGNKQTFENTGIINVLGTVINWPLIIVYSLIVLLLIFIIYKLSRRRKH